MLFISGSSYLRLPAWDCLKALILLDNRPRPTESSLPDDEEEVFLRNVVRFQVLTVTSMRMTVLWVFRHVVWSVYWRFRGTCCLHHKGDDHPGCNALWTSGWLPMFRRNILPPKRRYLPTSPHGVTTQKTKIDMDWISWSDKRIWDAEEIPWSLVPKPELVSANKCPA
jgi:hypothetical protein